MWALERCSKVSPAAAAAALGAVFAARLDIRDVDRWLSTQPVQENPGLAVLLLAAHVQVALGLADSAVSRYEEV